MSQEEIVKMKNCPRFLKQFLRQLVDNRILLKAMEKDPDFMNNPELLVFMNLSLSDALQKYYLYKKAGNISVDTNVSDADVEKAYNQLKADPRYAERLDRVPFDQLKTMLSQEIVKQRQMAEVQDLLNKVKAGFRHSVHDEIFGKTPHGTNDAPVMPGMNKPAWQSRPVLKLVEFIPASFIMSCCDWSPCAGRPGPGRLWSTRLETRAFPAEDSVFRS